MNIALDFDDTYTASPAFWDAFIAMAKASGHSVYLVTCRIDVVDNREAMKSVLGLYSPLRGIPWILTSMSPKRWFCEQQGIEIDIWIDDHPDSVENGR